MIFCDEQHQLSLEQVDNEPKLEEVKQDDKQEKPAIEQTKAVVQIQKSIEFYTDQFAQRP